MGWPLEYPGRDALSNRLGEKSHRWQSFESGGLGGLMSKRRLREFVTDPSSGQYSASRLLLMVLILVYLPIMGVCEALGIKLGIWAHIAVIVGSVAGVYGVNTAGRVWRQQSSSSEEFMPPGLPPPRAKPAPPGD